MSQIESLLTERLTPTKSKKVRQLAEQSRSGKLSTAATLFTSRNPTPDEVALMQKALTPYAHDELLVQNDAQQLATLTLEAKAIHHQAALLHGERIQKAKKILQNYQDGAFSFWLTQTYGNRQTPYNFLLYFELFQNIQKEHQNKLEEMPKAAAYVLAARRGSIEDKCQVIEHHYSQDRKSLLEEIQRRFPLPESDKRKKQWGSHLTRRLQILMLDVKNHKKELSPKDRAKLVELIKQFESLLA